MIISIDARKPQVCMTIWLLKYLSSMPTLEAKKLHLVKIHEA